MKKRQRYKSLFKEYRYRFGKGKCGYCGAELSGRRRYWCSVKCVDAMSIHGKSWPTLRKKFIKEHPECASCGKPRPERHWSCSDWVVDHIVPIALGGEEFDENNLQLLCQSCNKSKTRRDLSKIGKTRLMEYRIREYERTGVKKIEEFVE